MSITKGRYLTNTFFYTSIPLLRNALSFLTLPIITRYLLPKDYGIISLIIMIAGFGGIFYLGINSASMRYFFKYRDEADKLRQLFSSNLLFIIASSIIWGLILVLLFPFLNSFLFKGELKIIWPILAFVQFSFAYINGINQNILQNQHLGKAWFYNEFYAIIIQVGLSIILVVTRIFTFEALIISAVVAEAVKSVFIFFYVGKYYSVIFNKAYFRECINYSWPQVPTSVLSYIYIYLDRVLLSRFQGLSQVGIIDMSARVSSVLKLSQDGMGGALTPLQLELLTEKTEDSYSKLARVNLKVTFVMLLFSLLVILFTKELVMLLTRPEYYQVIYVVPLYIYYHVFGTLGLISYWLIYYHPNKTYLLIPLTALTLVISAGTNIFLIPKYGVMGAAVAAFISSAVVQIIQLVIGLKLTPIPISYMKLSAMYLLVFAGTIFLYALYYLKTGLFLGIFIKVLIVAAFIMFCYFMGIFSFHEIKEIIKGAKRKVLGRILVEGT